MTEGLILHYLLQLQFVVSIKMLPIKIYIFNFRVVYFVAGNAVKQLHVTRELNLK